MGAHSDSLVGKYVCALHCIFILDRCFVQLFWTGLILKLEFLTRLWVYIYFFFVLHLWLQFPHHLETSCLIGNGNWLIGLCVTWTLWSRCIALTFYMFNLLYLSIYFLYVIFAFCLLIFLILLFLVVGLVVAYSFFDLFHCSCSGSSMYFFCRLSELCCLCCHCLSELYYSFAIITLYLYLFLFSSLTHSVSYSRYCYCYLYHLALVLLISLLTLLVYNFPYGDFIVN